ncbi:MAG: hypothetical protein KC656_34300, partial [Myxococcales bacterium]|nr:hypothetical protein [Myxococcales bacterium]
METPWAASVIAELAAGRAVEVPGVGEFSWVQGHSAQRVVQAVHFRSSPELSAQVRGDGPLEGFAAALRDDRRVVVEGLGTFEVRERRGGPQTFTRLP